MHRWPKNWRYRLLLLALAYGKFSFSPEELREQVTSPNGTTQAALESFASDQLRETVKRAARCKKSIYRIIQCMI